MEPLTRRGFFEVLLALPLARYLPSPHTRRPAMPYDQLTRVTVQRMAPCIRDDFFLATPMFAHLRSRQSQRWGA